METLIWTRADLPDRHFYVHRHEHGPGRFADNATDWWHRVAIQAVANVGSADTEIQRVGLENLIYLTVFYREHLPMDYLLQAVMAAYDQAPNEVNRTLARAA